MAVNDYRFILASGSPRRKEILDKRGFVFEIIKSDNDEITNETEPSKVVLELSKDKAENVYEKIKSDMSAAGDTVILAADTIVACDGKILGKPADREAAILMIKMLEGHAHQVFTGVTIISIKAGAVMRNSFYEKTDVFVKSMSMADIESYVDTGESYDKAGGYGIQGEFGKYIDHFEGDYENVVGLPGDRVVLELSKIY